MKTFLDSSAFAKRFVDEPGSQAVDAICMKATELALSVICVPEIFSALNRRVRERRLSPQQYDEVKMRLSADLEDAIILDLTPSVIAVCIALLEDNPIRALDALHVACAVEWKSGIFVSADKRQIAAARKAGLRTKLVPS